ncbi:MAG: ABC transporter ATP-binding protein [Thermodesulfovibrionales bacterium]|nr:ABC transporter ATP-binding protein [Thermodesulfovibrionales bacterium]
MFIDVKNLSKHYFIGSEEIKAVDNVTFNIKKGEFASIVGHSGSGKTTLLSLIGGLTKPDSGSIVIDGIEILNLSDDELSEYRNKKVSFVYQFSSLIPTLTSLENVLLPAIFLKERRTGLVSKAKDLLALVGLKDKMNAYPSQLSGGQQRRVAIARAFINDPELVLADEPTGDLDEETEKEVMTLFERFNTEKGITFILVTHSSELARHASKRFHMSSGKLSEIA